MADCEFINSEFYIDESLPSSLENEKNLIKMMTTGCSVDLETFQPIRMNDKTETETVIILLQVFFSKLNNKILFLVFPQKKYFLFPSSFFLLFSSFYDFFFVFPKCFVINTF